MLPLRCVAVRASPTQVAHGRRDRSSSAAPAQRNATPCPRAGTRGRGCPRSSGLCVGLVGKKCRSVPGIGPIFCDSSCSILSALRNRSRGSVPSDGVVLRVADLRRAEEIADAVGGVADAQQLLQRELLEALRQVEHAEPDVARLVLLDVGQQLGEHRLDLRVGEEAEDHHRGALGEQLHREQLDGEVARREQAPGADREVRVELRHRHVQRGEVVAQRVEVARLVEDLAEAASRASASSRRSASSAATIQAASSPHISIVIGCARASRFSRESWMPPCFAIASRNSVGPSQASRSAFA